MQDFPSVLRACGLRRTVGRLAILRLFEGRCDLMSADEVADALERAGTPVHRTTVYRELRTLADVGILQVLDLGTGPRRYESAQSHHHHVRCTACGTIEAFPGTDALEGVERSIARRLKFSRLAHTLEFTGICKDCTAKPS